MKTTELKRFSYKELKLTHLKRRLMTVNNIMYVVALIMNGHKGLDNAISGDKLFQQVYGADRKPDYVDDFRWDYIRKAMHKLRQSTKLFIASRNNNGVYEYFVPTNTDEAQIYINNLENNINRMRSMQRKAMKSVLDGWYKLDWIDESKNLREIGEIYQNKQRKLGMKDGQG